MVSSNNGRLGLKKKYILRKNSQFQTVYTTGKSYSNRLLVVYIVPNATLERRVGFAAGKRLGVAVVRNRVKRLIREAYRLNQQRLIQGVSLLFVGRKSMTEVGLAAVNKAFLELCGRARLIK